MSNQENGSARCNFFLVGAPKAGTTSVDALLRGHPDVFLSPIKEPCHFCPDVAEQLAPAFRKKRRLDIARYLSAPVRPHVGLAWVDSSDDYARLFEGAGGHAVVGECSTFYLSSRAAAANIHAYNPQAKIVAILRRPLDRIRSHYEMDRAHGLTLRPLLALVEEELALGARANWGNCAFYVGASRYDRQLEEFRRVFPSDSICVLSFEALLADPQQQLARLYAFLGLRPPPGDLALPSANRARAARFPLYNSLLHRSGLKRFVSGAVDRVLPAHLGRSIKALYYARGRSVVTAGELKRVDALLRDAGVADAAVLA
jgi:hypothetical protein